MPPPPRQPLAERIRYAPQFKTETFIVPLLKAAIESALQKYPAKNNTATALDAGCGGQPFRPVLEALGYRYFSLDANPSPNLTVDFQCPLDANLPTALTQSAPFDFILCTEVLEHVADWPHTFDNLAQLLAPGGKLLLTSPFFYYLHEEPYDFFRPTLHAFQEFARRHNLRVLESQPLGDGWDILGTLAAGCRFQPLDDSPLSRSLAWTLWKIRDFIFRKIADTHIRKRVGFTGPLYLSNFVVLERPAS